MGFSNCNGVRFKRSRVATLTSATRQIRALVSRFRKPPTTGGDGVLPLLPDNIRERRRKYMKRILGLALPILCLALAFSGNAFANALTYTGSSGGRSASATFDLTGNTLDVTLTNTSLGDAPDATWILMSVMFDTSSTLTPVSASLNGSTVYGSFVHNVGEGWQYKSGVSAHGKNSGISGTGLGVFGRSGNFFTPGQHLGGSDYGIAPIGFTNTGNPSIQDPIIQNSIEFTLTAAQGFSLDQLGDTVVFQYGTDLTEPSFDGTLQTTTPEPATMGMLGSGLLVGFMQLRRRFLKP